MPSNATRKIATTGGCGVLVFQRPIVPVPAEIAKQSVDVRKQWEKRWLESEAGQAADRAAQDHSFSVAADGAFKTEGVAPGVYKLAVEFFRVREKSLEIDHDIAWFVQEVTIPAGAKDKPLDLGKYTATAANLLRGDMAPDFGFQTADGRTHRLSEYRGKKVIVEFTAKWDAMERFGGMAEMNRRYLVGEKAGPTVYINVSSDLGPRPAVTFAQDAKFQYIQAFVPPKADVWKAYDVNRPRSWVETHIAQDGKVIRK
jgi:peroxiredoxin